MDPTVQPLGLNRASRSASNQDMEREGGMFGAVAGHMADFMKWMKNEDDNPMFEIVASKWYQGVMAVALILALFLPDMMTIIDQDTVVVMDVILTIIFGCFVVELLLSCVTSEGYFLGFWFWADLVGCFSLLVDVTWALGSNEPMKEDFGGGAEQLVLLRAARAAKIGARAGRFSRVIKFLKCFPGMKSQNPDEERVDTAVVMFQELMTALSTRVAMLTLIITVMLPFFSLGTYPQSDFSMRIWVESLHDWNVQGVPLNQTEIPRLADFYKDELYIPFRVEVGDEAWDFAPSPTRVPNEFHLTQGNAKILFDFTRPMQFQSWMNIVGMFIVIIVMVAFALLLSNNISLEVLLPLEQLLAKVRGVSEAIFKSVNELEKSKQKHRSARDAERKERALLKMNETELLERAVGKLAVMSELAVATKAGISDEQMKNMNADDRAMLEYMQGAGPAKATPSQRQTCAAPDSTSRRSIKVDDIGDHDDSKKGDQAVGRMISGVDQPRVTIAEVGLSEALIDSWNFNVLDLSQDQLSVAVLYFLCDSPQQCRQYLSRGVAMNYIKAAESGYIQCPYHSWLHGVDTTHNTYRSFCLLETHKNGLIASLDRFAVMISAVCHDVGHPGFNNPFLIDTRHDLAIQYNDISPLENLHCSKLFEICTNEDCNVFAKLNSEQYKEVRRVCIQTILHTDMKHHFGMVKDLQILYELNSEVFSKRYLDGFKDVLKEDSTRILILQLILHAADISNSAKPSFICKAWSKLVLEEFFAQGDKEKELGIPVQMLNDRDKVNKPHSQIGFIDFVVAPLVLANLKIFPQLRETGQHLVDNHGDWIEVWSKESNPEQKELDGMKARNEKLKANFAEVLQPPKKGKEMWTKAASETKKSKRVIQRTESSVARLEVLMMRLMYEVVSFTGAAPLLETLPGPSLLQYTL